MELEEGGGKTLAGGAKAVHSRARGAGVAACVIPGGGAGFGGEAAAGERKCMLEVGAQGNHIQGG